MAVDRPRPRGAEARDKAVKYEVTPLGLTEVKPDDDAFDRCRGHRRPAPVKVEKRATAAQLLAESWVRKNRRTGTTRTGTTWRGRARR